MMGTLTSPQQRAGAWLERIGIAMLLALTVAGLCGVAVSGLAFARGELRWGYAGMLFMVAVLGVPVGIAWIAALRGKTKAWSRARVSLFGIGWGMLTLALVAAPFTNWPLHLSFTLEQASLESLARRVERGAVPALPLQQGVFTVTKAEKDDRGRVWLWICSHGDAACHSGALLYCASEDMPPDMDLYQRGLNARVDVAPRWHCLGYGG